MSICKPLIEAPTVFGTVPEAAQVNLPYWWATPDLNRDALRACS